MDNTTSVATYNVNGMGNITKCREIFYYLHKRKFDIVFLQETHCQKSIGHCWNTMWGSKIYYSHGESNTRGVAILLDKKLNYQVHNIISSKDDQYLIMYCTLKQKKLLLVNIYAPNQDTPMFFQNLFIDIECFSPDYVLLGGDLNFAFNAVVDRQGSVNNNNKSASWMQNRMENSALVDIYRALHAGQAGFTYTSTAPKLNFSRLDHFICLESFLQFVKEIKVLPSFKSDHSMVVMQLRFDPFKWGSVCWRLNTLFLRDRDYIEKINKLINIHLDQTYDTASLKWEVLKLVVNSSTLQFAANRKKSDNNKMMVLEKKLNKLKLELEGSNPIQFQDTYNQIRLVKQELSEINKKKSQGAILRSRANWAKNADLPTKYFLNLEKKNFLNKTIYRLEDKAGNSVEGEEQILQEIQNYFCDLYTEKNTPDLRYINKLHIPQVSLEIKEECDAPLTILEIGNAIKQLANNKVGGTDGLPAEFYKIFYHKIKDLLLDVYNEAITSGKLHLTARRSVISLLEKPRTSGLRLTQWRPLSLLNVDNRIYGKCLALQMQKAMDTIVHYSQTGFIKGRHLLESVMKIMEIVNTCETKACDGLLISFDFRKAFDTVSWPALFKALQAFGFGEQFINMTKILYSDPLATVMNNGKWSNWFTPTRGTRQGCCFSPSCFTVLVELLGLALRQNDSIIGIKVGEETIKAGQFADDLWTSLHPSTENIDEVLNELDSFGTFSGLRINPEKCTVLKLGPHKDSDAKFYTKKKLFWSPKDIRILGIQIYPDIKLMYERNFLDTLQKAQDILESWEHRKPSLLGRITIVNTLVTTLFVHKLLTLPTPPQAFFKKFKLMMTKFLWQDKPARISYARLIQDHTKLGLKLTDMETKDTALKAAWLARWKNRDKDELKWVTSGMPIKDWQIWDCNLNFADAERLVPTQDNPFSTSISILKAWTKIHYQENFDNIDQILTTPLWGNSRIRRANFPIFDSQLTSSNIDSVIDIVDLQNHKFLGGLSLHLNHLIAERVSAPYQQFGTLPIGIFLSNLVSGQLETSLMTSYCHF